MKKIDHGSYPKKHISKQLDVMAKAIRGIRKSSDIENIHDARVASRRLRTAFWVFKGILPKKGLKGSKKSIRRVAKALGACRDLDVQIDFLNRIARRLKRSPNKAGMETLSSLLQQKRQSLQARVVSALDEFEKTGALQKISARLDKVPKRSKRCGADTLRKIGEKKITTRLQDLFKFEPYVGLPDNVAELHQMRIAAKHLRYALECLKPLYGPETSTFINSARKIQRALGRLHDFDVWIESLPNAIGREKKDKDVEAALSYFSNKCKALRSRTYNAFVKTWETQRKEKVWYRLPQFIAQYKRQIESQSEC